MSFNGTFSFGDKSNKSFEPAPGYTGKLDKDGKVPVSPEKPYEEYDEDLENISTALRSGIYGGQTSPFPQRSISQEVAKEMEETWKNGYQADQTFHTTTSPDKLYQEAELMRRNISKDLLTKDSK